MQRGPQASLPPGGHLAGTICDSARTSFFRRRLGTAGTLSFLRPARGARVGLERFHAGQELVFREFAVAVFVELLEQLLGVSHRTWAVIRRRPATAATVALRRTGLISGPGLRPPRPVAFARRPLLAFATGRTIGVIARRRRSLTVARRRRSLLIVTWRTRAARRPLSRPVFIFRPWRSLAVGPAAAWRRGAVFFWRRPAGASSGCRRAVVLRSIGAEARTRRPAIAIAAGWRRRCLRWRIGRRCLLFLGRSWSLFVGCQRGSHEQQRHDAAAEAQCPGTAGKHDQARFWKGSCCAERHSAAGQRAALPSNVIGGRRKTIPGKIRKKSLDGAPARTPPVGRS